MLRFVLLHVLLPIESFLAYAAVVDKLAGVLREMPSMIYPEREPLGTVFALKFLLLRRLVALHVLQYGIFSCKFRPTLRTTERFNVTMDIQVILKANASTVTCATQVAYESSRIFRMYVTIMGIE